MPPDSSPEAQEGPVAPLDGAALLARLPQVRGRLEPMAPLAPFTWLRVGGPAEALFQPADVEDLEAFLAGAPADVPITPLGVGSNLIVRDGGVPGVCIRLGRGFNAIQTDGLEIRAGAAALDARVAGGGGGGGDRRAGVSARRARGDRRSASDERRRLWALSGGCVRFGAGCRPPGAPPGFVGRADGLRLSRQRAAGSGLCLRHAEGRGRRSGGGPRPHGGADGPAGGEPAGQGPNRRLHLPQSFRLLLHRRSGRSHGHEGLGADRESGVPRIARGAAR